MALRKARVGDLPVLEALVARYKALLNPAPTTHTLTKHLLSGTAILDSGVMILYRHHLAGYRLAGIRYPKDSTEITHIVSRYTGRGYGKQVLMQFCDEAPGAVFLNVLEVNKACGFYEHLGFKQVGRLSWACGWVRYYQRDKECL